MLLDVQKLRIFFFVVLHFRYIFTFLGTWKPGFRVIFIFIFWGWCKWVKYRNRFHDLLFCVTHMVERAHIKDRVTQSSRVAMAQNSSFPRCCTASGVLQAQWFPAPTIAVGPNFLLWSLFHFHIWSLFFLLPVIYSFFGSTLPKATTINSGQNKNHLSTLENKQKQTDIGERRQGKSLGEFHVF